MSIIREMRERQATTVAPEPSGHGRTVLIVCAAFALGALAIAGWKMWPLSPAPVPVAQTAAKAQPTASTPAPALSGNRLGRAEAAPLLELCVKEDKWERLSPVAYFMTIDRATHATGFAATINPDRRRTTAELATFWNGVAECMFQTSSWNACDIDNRQFAVTAVAASLRITARLEAEEKKPETQKVLANATRTRPIVLNALRTHVHNGYFIAADFGAAPPPEIKAILAETKPAMNRCGK